MNDAVPASAKYKNRWAGSIFAEWQRLREVKVLGIRLWWSLQGLRFTQGYRSERRYCRNGRSVAELLVVKIRGGKFKNCTINATVSKKE